MANKQPIPKTESEKIKAGWKWVNLPPTEDSNDEFVRFQINGMDIVLQRGEATLVPPHIYDVVKKSYHMKTSVAKRTQMGIRNESDKAFSRLDVAVGQ